jgi:putative transposase
MWCNFKAPVNRLTAATVAHMLVVSTQPNTGDTTMTAIPILPSTLATLKQLATSDLPAAMRQQTEQMLSSLMESEVSSQIGASLSAQAPERSSYRNGYRTRKLETQLGSLDIRIPRLREGTYFPSFLEPHCRLHSSLVQVVMEAYSQGVSTRKIDDLAQALGMEGISKSAVSRMLEDLSTGVATFCARPLMPCPYVFFDARYEHVREHGRVVSKAVLVAVGVTTEGQRELLGYQVAPGENDETWSAFLQGLVDRGLTGVRLTVSDAHAGLRRALQSLFPGASWQRCTIHLARNLAAEVGYRHRAEVSGLLKLILSSPDIAAAREQLKVVLDILHKRHPKVAHVLESAGEDFLAYMHFPCAHWKRLHSTNLVERLNREIKRRTRVVSIFPSDTSLLNLVGAVLERVCLPWGGKAYVSLDGLRQLEDPLNGVRGALAASRAPLAGFV